jgi:hypothetical protein
MAGDKTDHRPFPSSQPLKEQTLSTNAGIDRFGRLAASLEGHRQVIGQSRCSILPAEMSAIKC